MGCSIKERIEKALIKEGALSKNKEIIDIIKFDKVAKGLYTYSVNNFNYPESAGLFVYSRPITNNIESRGNRIRPSDYSRKSNKLFYNKEQLDLLEILINEKEKNEDESDSISLSSKKLESLLDPSLKDELFNFNNDSEITNEDNSSEEKEDIIDFILFNNEDKKSFTANEVLENIYTNYKEFSGEANDVINKLIPILNTTNAKIKFVSTSSFKDSNSIMEYNPTTNEILISKESLEGLSEKEVIGAFLHEVVHSVTVEALDNPKTTNQKIFKDLIEEVFEDFKKQSSIDKEGNLKAQTYGFTNVYEFAAEAFTNPLFQGELKRIEGNKKKSLWDKIVDGIRTLLGLKKITTYDRIIDGITSVVEESNYNGGIVLSEETLAKKRTKERTVEYESLKTLEDRQDRIIEDIKSNLKENISKYDYLIKKYKDSSKKDTSKMKDYKVKLEELLNEVETLKKSEQWRAITIYVKQLNGSVGSLKKRFEEEREGLNQSDKDILETVDFYYNYLKANSMVEDIQKFLSTAIDDPKLPIKREEAKELKDLVIKANGEYGGLKDDFLFYKKKGLYKKLNHRRFNTIVLKRWRIKLGKEYTQLNITEPKEAWISRQMNTTYAYQVDSDVYDNVAKLLEDPDFDITQATMMMNSAINTNSKMIQVTQNIISSARELKVQQNRDRDIKLDKIFKKFIKAKGNKKASELYKNMFELSKDGKYYLKGEYSIKYKEAYEEELVKYNKLKEELAINYGEKSSEYKKGIKDSDFNKWKKENTVLIKRQGQTPIRVPKDKWKNKELTGVEKEVIDSFKEIMDISAKNTFGIKSLKSYLMGAVYYKLPSITKSDLERTLEGDALGVAKDTLVDLKSIRVDDVGYEEQDVSKDKNIIKTLRVHFRGDIDAKDQSLDLFTIMRLESKNGINFKENKEIEITLGSLLEVAEEKKFYRSENGRVPILGRYLDRDKPLEKSGIESNVYKRMRGLIEANLYDELHKDAGRIAGVDLNKAISYLNAWTGTLGMALNEVSSPINVLNGHAQFFLETLSGDFISRKSLKEAEADYFRDIKNNVRDSGSPINTSYTNQMLEMFDTIGSVNVSVKQGFMANTKLRTFANIHSLSFMQNMGEHWLSSVLTSAILSNIKVLNANNEFIDKQGNVVKSKEKAASVKDMLKMKDGKLVMDDKVVYTTHTIGVKYKEGGKEMLNALVKKKAFDTLGNYDPNMQPELMRLGVGKLTMMYRKYLVPMGVARLRGFSKAHKNLEDLEDHEVFFNEALQEFETGTYTELARVLANGVWPAIRQMKMSLVKDNWDNMSDFQKKQFRKGLIEIAISSALLPALLLLLEGLRGDDDDDNSWLIYSMLLTRRLQSELQSYLDPNEQWRILKSPIPSMRVVESFTDLFGTLITPLSFEEGEVGFSWNDRYETGKNKGDLRILKDLKELVPVLTKDGDTYEEGYNFFTMQSQ